MNTETLTDIFNKCYERFELKRLIKEELFKAINNKKEFNEADVNRDKWGRFAEKGGNFPHRVDLSKLEAISFSWDEFNVYKDKESVENYYNTFIKGHSLTHKDPNVGKIRFVDLGLDETEYQNRRRNYYILTKIPQIIEKSEYDRTEPPKHPHKNIKQFHILYGKIKLPSKEQALIINIAEDSQGNKYYYYKPIQTIKIKEPHN